MKRYLTSICFFLIALVQIVGHYTGWGIFVWGMTVVCLMLAAYCTKYVKKPERM
ncbi:hypothetical protein [Ectobacillus ponti]|uniref:Uncharacterized protein n=1 Tax=Ectobacillus ponti TaxID=2961894 RepID=A0AA41X834_9BACI|nr:hypothetical protein [Ectobacillus ponti]MCP8968419.1 hypothetical protein [Ectobacillus ponti]